MLVLRHIQTVGEELMKEKVLIMKMMKTIKILR